MRARTRVLGAAVMAVIGVGGTSACELLPGETYEDDASVSEKITSVRLENGPGGVTVRGKDNLDEVKLHREVEYHGDKPAGPTHEVDGGVLKLGGCGDECEVRYTVDVPAGIPVTGETSSGELNMSKLGKVQVTTGSGGISLNDIAGAVSVRTSNGQIKGRDLKGDGIKAETSNGDVDLAPAEAQDVQVKTSNGGAELAVPAGSYQVAAKSGNGSREIGVENDPSGDHRLTVVTSNGDITVKSS